MQFGPISARPESRASSVSVSCSAKPSSLAVSAKPEVKNAAPATSFSTHCRRMKGATLRGTATSTKSISSGISRRLV